MKQEPCGGTDNICHVAEARGEHNRCGSICAYSDAAKPYSCAEEELESLREQLIVANTDREKLVSALRRHAYHGTERGEHAIKTLRELGEGA